MDGYCSQGRTCESLPAHILGLPKGKQPRSSAICFFGKKVIGPFQTGFWLDCVGLVVVGGEMIGVQAMVLARGVLRDIIRGNYLSGDCTISGPGCSADGGAGVADHSWPCS